MTEWLVPSSSQLDYDKLRKESLNYPEISTACLLVYVGHCTDLPGKCRGKGGIKSRFGFNIENVAAINTVLIDHKFIICRKFTKAIPICQIIGYWPTR